MNAPEFIRTREEGWKRLEAELSILEESGRKAPERGQQSEVPTLFRQLCADLALARERCFSPLLIDQLNELAMRSCQQLYGRRSHVLEDAGRFLIYTFPQLVRSEWRIVSLCMALFWLPFFALLFWGDQDARWFEAILGSEQMQQLHSMYSKPDILAENRGKFGQNFAMFGMYIWNNVGITFRAFASGALAGVGSLFTTAFNGVAIGAAASYVTRNCEPEHFWGFVAGHSAFELTGIILGGVAGLRLGLGLIAPGTLSRRAALALAADRALPMISGAALLVVAAAFIEGFWSAQPLPVWLKYAVGILLWILTAWYFVFCGREKGARAK